MQAWVRKTWIVLLPFEDLRDNEVPGIFEKNEVAELVELFFQEEFVNLKSVKNSILQYFQVGR